MEWGSKRHPAETLIEWGAPAVLASASAWAAATVTGASTAAIAAGFSAYLLGFAAIRGASNEEMLLDVEFEPAPFEGESDELLLDDPLVEVKPDSRMSKLFDAPEQQPGVLVARIADYLGDRPDRPVSVSGSDEAPVLNDATAALHAALANIRASLR